ncbi:MAG: Eco57I restriction-modification methylase domain-containing protein [Candidatus Hodarchaeales archaeon]|jgi:hypothetical protein
MTFFDQDQVNELFSLNKDSDFVHLTISLANLFLQLKKPNEPLQLLFSFRESLIPRKSSKIKPSRLWKVMLDQTKIDISELIFCFETSLAFIGRILLLKLAEKFNIPNIELSNRIHKFKDFERNKKYQLIISEIIDLFHCGQTHLFTCIYESDMFMWWLELLTPWNINQNAKKLIKYIVQISDQINSLQYDSENASILLNNIYSLLFDAKTRKFLGEFYTPLNLVNFILDCIDYQISSDLLNANVIDPSCGTGAFLDSIFDKFIESVKLLKNPSDNWSKFLHRLSISPQIVGFDINPFSIFMARLRIIIKLMPYYNLVKDKEPSFIIKYLPFHVTDFLIQGDEKFHQDKSFLKLKNDNIFSMNIKKITTDSESKFIFFTNKFLSESIEFQLPTINTLKDHKIILSGNEYYTLCLALFFGAKSINIVNSNQNKIKIELRSILNEFFAHSVLIKLISQISEILIPYWEIFVINYQKFNTYLERQYLLIIEHSILSFIIKKYISFNFVTGNPPYIDFRHQEKKKSVIYKQIYSEFADGQSDLYVFFLDRGIQFLTHGGTLGYILPNQWLYTVYGKQVRNFLSNKFQKNELIFDKWIDFRDQMMFDEVTNLTGICTFKKCANENNKLKVVRIFNKNNTNNLLGEIISEMDKLEDKVSVETSVLISEGFDTFLYPYKQLNEKIWFFNTFKERLLFKKLKSMGSHTFKNLFDICTGTQTSADALFKVDIVSNNVNNSIVKVCNRNGLEFEIEKKILRQTIRERQPISRWTIKNLTWLIYPYKVIDHKGKKKSSIISISELKNSYSKAYKYFKLPEIEYKLKNRERGRWANKLEFYCYGYQKNHLKLEKIKLIPQSLSSRMSFTFDESGKILLTDAAGRAGYILKNDRTIDNYKILLGLFNTSIFDFIAKHFCAPYGGGSYQFTEQFIKEIPIPFDDLRYWDKKWELLNLVNKIIECKEDIRVIRNYEIELENLITELFELTSEEFLLIKNFHRKFTKRDK